MIAGQAGFLAAFTRRHVSQKQKFPVAGKKCAKGCSKALRLALSALITQTGTSGQAVGWGKPQGGCGGFQQEKGGRGGCSHLGRWGVCCEGPSHQSSEKSTAWLAGSAGGLCALLCAPPAHAPHQPSSTSSIAHDLAFKLQFHDLDLVSDTRSASGSELPQIQNWSRRKQPWCCYVADTLIMSRASVCLQQTAALAWLVHGVAAAASRSS